jgi:hypothetical protein
MAFETKFKSESKSYAAGTVLERTVPEILPEGVHRLTITDVQNDGVKHSPWGDNPRMTVVMESTTPSKKNPGKKIVLRKSMNAVLSPKSNFGLFIAKLGFEIGKKFEVITLQGVSFEASVTNTLSKTTELEYSNIEPDGIIPGTVKGVPAQLV